MKKSQKILTLGELILAVASKCKTNKEAVAKVADLLESGKIKLGKSEK